MPEMRKIPFPVVLPGDKYHEPKVIGFLWFSEDELARFRRKVRPVINVSRALRGASRGSKQHPFIMAHMTQGIEGLNGKDMWDGVSPRFVNPGEKIYL